MFTPLIHPMIAPRLTNGTLPILSITENTLPLIHIAVQRMQHWSLFLLITLLAQVSTAQVLCVQCFEQNDSIGVDVGTGDLIMNGGFEATNCATGCVGVYCPNSASYNCGITGWTCTGGGALTYACVYDSAQYMVVERAKAAYFGNSYANPCSGTLTSTFPNNDTACIGQLDCALTGIPAGGYPLSGPNYGGANGISLSQTVNGLVPGNIYVLEFWAGGEYQGWFSHNGLFAVDVGFGKTFLKCKVTHQAPDTGTRYLIQFMATSASHSITFTNWGHVCGSCTELVLDDVRLYTPDHLPASVTLCATGLGIASGPIAEVRLDRTEEMLIIRCGDPEPVRLYLFDVAGHTVLARSLASSTSIAVHTLPPGSYIWTIQGSTGTAYGKLVK